MIPFQVSVSGQHLRAILCVQKNFCEIVISAEFPLLLPVPAFIIPLAEVNEAYHNTHDTAAVS